MSTLINGIDKAARRARDAVRRRRLESGESGWGSPVVPPPVLTSRANQPRRVAIVGAGRQGATLAVAATKVVGAQIVGLADMDLDRLTEVARLVGLDDDRCYSDASTMFERSPIDLAIIATTAPFHIELAQQAKRSGIRRILLEKPIDISYRDAARFVAECESDGVLLGVNYSRRWLNDYRSIAAAIRAGQIGPVRIITAQTGAGELAMLGSHYLDLCRWLLDSEPVSVSAQLHPPVRANARGADYDDPTGHVVVRFASGARAYLDFEDDLPRSDAVVTIRGDHGMIVVEENGEVWTLRSRSTRNWTFPYADQFRPMPIATRVVFGMLTDDDAACTGTDGLAALEFILAAHHSSRAGGQAVALPLTAEQRGLVVRFP